MKSTSLKSILTSFSFSALALSSVLAPIFGSEPEAQLFPLSSVRLLDGPFKQATAANRAYLLAHDPDRLLAPFLREAGLPAKATSYGNWENSGLDGHTAGHYLTALAMKVASGEDTADGEFARRLGYMLDELERSQEAYGNGYIGGVPGSREIWGQIREGNIDAHGFGLNGRWVPWYNVHKTFAGLRDAYVIAGREKARELLVGMGDWVLELTEDLSDAQMQDMLRSEHGGMNEAMAEIYAITGEKKYLRSAERFNHDAVLDPLMRREDRLNGMHANTQIPKVIGLERIAQLADDEKAHVGSEFFWHNVVEERSVAFGGNSVNEHFNPPGDFRPMLEHREGPETCNTYNMLKLTESLFTVDTDASYVDFYERALYNHILSAIHPTNPGYVYFTPIRPEHYRVYSVPEDAFWCCVGSGMENPGKYGQFIYARSGASLYVNLFIPSELKASPNLTVRQETEFPDEPKTRLEISLKQPAEFSLNIRRPVWAKSDAFAVRVNGEPFATDAAPSSYVGIHRTWRDGDVVEVDLPMDIRTERLPDGSDWVAFLYGPIVLAAPSGDERMPGIFADGSRMGHIAAGPLVPFDEVPVLLASEEAIPKHVEPVSGAGELTFRLKGIVEPETEGGVRLKPFFRIHGERYQMYWQLTSAEAYAANLERLREQERLRAAREAATLDHVAIGEQQPEVEHDFAGEGTNTGFANERRWRDGQWFQYTLDTQGADAVELLVTYWGGDDGRAFDILVNGEKIASEALRTERPGEFLTKSYPVPESILESSLDGKLTVKFQATQLVAGGIFDLRLVKAER